MFDGFAEVLRGSVLHLPDHKGSDLSWRVLLISSLDPSVSVGVFDDFVRDVLDIHLHLSICEFPTDQPEGLDQLIDSLREEIRSDLLDANMVFSALTTACRRAG